jgi:hypothetical protein
MDVALAESVAPGMGAAPASGSLDQGVSNGESGFADWRVVVAGVAFLNHLLIAAPARDVARERRQGKMKRTRVFPS